MDLQIIKFRTLFILSLFLCWIPAWGQSVSLYLHDINESQKFQYKEQDWQKFFGTAVYLRQKRANDEINKVPYQSAALEVLALAKHCQFGPALRIGQWHLKNNNYSKAEVSALNKALDRVQLQANFSIQRGSPDTDSPRQLFAEEQQYWAINLTQLQKLTSPTKLRLLVENKCPN